MDNDQLKSQSEEAQDQDYELIDGKQFYYDVTEYGYILNDKVYVKGNSYFPSRPIGEVRESPQKSLKYYMDKYNIMKVKAQTIKSRIESETNIGSYLVGIGILKERLKSYKGIGDYESIFHMLEGLEKQIHEYISNNRKRNLKLREELVEEASQLVDTEENWEANVEKANQLRERWLVIGKTPIEEGRQLQKKFQILLRKFIKKRIDNISLVPDKVTIAAYNRLLSYMRNHNTALNKQKVLEHVRDIEKEWESLGDLPSEIFDKLDKEFKRLNQNFYRLLKADPIIELDSPATTKRQLLKYIENILFIGFPFPIKTVQSVQRTWRAKPNAVEDRDLNKKFVFLCNQIFEINFMEKQLRVRIKNYREFSDIELLEAKIQIMKSSLKEDEQLYEELKFLPNLYDDLDKIRAFKNCSTRLQTKTFILDQLEENLQVLKSVDLESDVDAEVDSDEV